MLDLNSEFIVLSALVGSVLRMAQRFMNCCIPNKHANLFKRPRCKANYDGVFTGENTGVFFVSAPSLPVVCFKTKRNTDNTINTRP